MQNPQITRRRFLGLGALAGAAAAGLPLLQSTPGAAATDPGQNRPEGQWVFTCCNMCGGQTGIRVLVSPEGRALKIEPNPENPIGVANIYAEWQALKGAGAAMCPKGNAALMSLYDPDRVKRPLLRTNKAKGPDVDPQWKEISWDEAFSLMTARIKALIDAGEPEKFVFFGEDSSLNPKLEEDFTGLVGSPNFHLHSNLCDVSRKASFTLALGHDRPLMDFAQSKYLLIFGWNPISAVKWSHLPRVYGRALERGAKIVVVDPRLSTTASKAQEWVPIRPGTDGALALAMAHVIIAEGLYDKEFVRDWVHGLGEFSRYVADKTPEWAEPITGVPAETITRLARELATTKPAAVDAWSGPGQHSNAVHGGWAIAALNLLIGTFDQPGGMLLPDKKGPKYPDLAVPKPKAKRLDGRNDLYPMGHSSGVYTEILGKMADGTAEYMPKVGMVFMQNLVLSVPGTAQVIEALKKLEFLVVADLLLSETAMLADLVLPGTHFLERYDLNSNWVTFPSVALRQPTVKPLFGQPVEYEVLLELGKRLGLKNSKGEAVFANFNYEQYLSDSLKAGIGVSLDEIKRLPGATWNDTRGTTYRKFATPLKEADLKGTEVDPATGVIYKLPLDAQGQVDPKGAKTAIGLMVGGKPVVGFSTPTRKAQLYAPWLAQKKDRGGRPLEVFPSYRPRDWQPDDKYPLFLVNWKSVSHTHSRTFNNPYLMELAPDNPLWINPATAARLGIRDGDAVWVESPHGKARAAARVTQRIHPEVVGWQHGFGHWALGRYARGKGVIDGQFNLPKSDPISGMALHKEVCVRVSRA